MKIYLAGPMSGLPDLNYPAFYAAAAQLRDAGYTVVNPAELVKDAKASWYDCMRVDIQALVVCDSICLLPNWTLSRGARLEFHIASQLSMQVLEYSAFVQVLDKRAKARILGIDWARDANRFVHSHPHADGMVTGEPR